MTKASYQKNALHLFISIDKPHLDFLQKPMTKDTLDKFQAKVKFAFHVDEFTICTASTREHLQLALRLRHQVFLEEGLGTSHESGMEFDSFDHYADHLMIIDNTRNEAIGTYRLLHTEFCQEFYSQSEFFLEDFLKQPGVKLELGRACTHIDYRTGRTMDLLWQGLSRYIMETKTRYLFGCSSLNTTDPGEVFSVMKSLQVKNHWSSTYNIRPKEKYQFPKAKEAMEEGAIDRQILRTLPPLLRSYLHAGSKVYGTPARDEAFACADLFTILDLWDLNKKFQERYLPDFSVTP